MSHREIAMAMGKTEGYIRNLFVGIYDVNSNHQLESLICHAGVTLQDVAETKGISEYHDRLKLLEQRGNGSLNSAELRERIKALKYDTSADTASSGKVDVLSPELAPSVKMSVSDDGLVIKLAFNNEASAKVMETGIGKLLKKHGIQAVNTQGN
jgi:hypothetical protein